MTEDALALVVVTQYPAAGVVVAVAAGRRFGLSWTATMPPRPAQPWPARK